VRRCGPGVATSLCSFRAGTLRRYLGASKSMPFIRDASWKDKLKRWGREYVESFDHRSVKGTLVLLVVIVVLVGWLFEGCPLPTG
jgi:hypothetical protein